MTSADSQPDTYTFYRVGYLYVRASASHRQREWVKFEAIPELTKSSFEIPTSLPARLKSLVVDPRPAKNDVMPDYEEFLER